MTNRGLFVLLAAASIGIDVAITLYSNHSGYMIISAVLVLAIAAFVIFGALRGYTVAVIILIALFVLSVLVIISDFFPIEALRNIIEPEETVGLKIVNLFTL